MWGEVLSEYLVVLIATAPASAAVEIMCDSAYVSGTVTSQASVFPLARGIIVTPFARLPPWETCPVCSFMCRNLRSVDWPPNDVVQHGVTLMSRLLLLHERPWRLWRRQAFRRYSCEMNKLWFRVSVHQISWLRHLLVWVPWKQIEACEEITRVRSRSCFESGVVNIDYSWGHDCAEDWVHDRFVPGSLDVLHDNLWNEGRGSCTPCCLHLLLLLLLLLLLFFFIIIIIIYLYKTFIEYTKQVQRIELSKVRVDST